MSSNYAGTNTLHGQITIPSDGDPAVAESVNVALRDLQDNSVYATTELAHKLDDRGGNYAMTGNLSLTGAGRTVTLGTEITRIGVNPMAGYDSVLTVVAPEVNFQSDLPFGTQILNVKSSETWLTSPLTTIGSGASAQLTVNAETTFDQDVEFTNDVVIGTSSSDSLTVGGPAEFDDSVVANGDVTIGSSNSDTLLVRAATHALDQLQVDGAFTAAGNSVIGSDSADSLEVNATASFEATVTVEGALTVNDDVQLGSSSSHDVTIAGQFLANRNVTLGNSSSDELTVNAQLVAPLVCQPSSAGRVPLKVASGPNADQSFSATDGNLIIVTSLSTTRTYTVSDTGAVDGDYIEFVKSATGGALVVQVPGSPDCTVAAGSRKVIRAFRVSAGAWATITWSIDLFS